jgi:hypothetical protein
MNEWMNEWKKEWKNERMSERINERIKDIFVWIIVKICAIRNCFSESEFFISYCAIKDKILFGLSWIMMKDYQTKLILKSCNSNCQSKETQSGLSKYFQHQFATVRSMTEIDESVIKSQCHHLTELSQIFPKKICKCPNQLKIVQVYWSLNDTNLFWQNRNNQEHDPWNCNKFNDSMQFIISETVLFRDSIETPFRWSIQNTLKWNKMKRELSRISKHNQ